MIAGKLRGIEQRRFRDLLSVAPPITTGRHDQLEDRSPRDAPVLGDRHPGDLLQRLVGENVSRGMGQQVVIENKVGAGGLVGAEAVANSAADGYTLAMVSADSNTDLEHRRHYGNTLCVG